MGQGEEGEEERQGEKSCNQILEEMTGREEAVDFIVDLEGSQDRLKESSTMKSLVGTSRGYHRCRYLCMVH